MAPKKRINLALQGGGAHGAFTWGVLAALLESDEIAIDGVSGTSAGAMNAAVLMSGYMRGGEKAACAALEAFWREVSEAAAYSPFRRSPLDMLMGNWSLDASPLYIAYDMASRVVSPSLVNPLEFNPLEPIIRRHVDFELLRSCTDLRLFVAATNVRTGKVKVFPHTEMDVPELLASACIPMMFTPVNIDGEAYWDGGFAGNPPLFPLFYETSTADTVIVQINPIERAEVPYTAREVVNRVNEITFNASLLKEMRAVRFVQRLIEAGRLSADEYMHVRLHRISSDALRPMSASSKMNAEWRFLKHLFTIGHDAASRWLETHFEYIGVCETIDLDAELN